MLRAIKKVLNRVVYGGDTHLDDYEQRLLSMARTALPEADREVLDAQVRAVQRIKRYNDHRMVTFQFDGEHVPPLGSTAPEFCLVSYVETSATGEEKTVGALIAHRGRLSSLELKTNPAKINPGRWERIRAIYPGADPEVASQIDREEHGDEGTPAD